MGNLSQDFWRYTLNNKVYFGIVEVTRGDLQYRKTDNKTEVYIGEALEYMMKPESNFMSHMSLQSYPRFLKGKGKSIREEDEEKYYPFTVEIESKYRPGQVLYKDDYKEAVGEALRLVTYLTYELSIAEKDILIIINNSRSVYIMVNPKAYALKPAKNLHKIYFEMYQELNEHIGFKHSDTHMYAHNSLIKTPNSFYCNGYVVPISVEELKQLYENPGRKKLFTAKKRTVNYDVPGEVSQGFISIYENAKEKVNFGESKYDYDSKNKKNSKGKISFLERNKRNCIKYIENTRLEKGCRNSALFSVAVDYKDKGFTEEQVVEKLIMLANKWSHDESDRQIEAIVESIFRHDRHFKCSRAQQLLDIDENSICKGCPYAAQKCCRKEKIVIHKDIIEELWVNGASTRHYIAYLELSDKGLFNKWFSPAEQELNDRNIRELCTYTNQLIREKNGDRILITNQASGKAYYLPQEFMENKVYQDIGEYIKHYLKLIFSGYKSYDRYIRMNVSKETIQKNLGYKSIHGVYKLFNKLQELGLIIVDKKKGFLKSIYYESYKVISIDEYKAKKKAKKSNKAADIYTGAEGRNVVNMGQEVSTEAFDYKDKNNKSQQRGSPG